MSPRAKTLLAAAGLVAFGAAAYFDSLHGPFVFDDKRAIVENPAIRHLWPIGPILAGPRPMVDLTFAINYSLGRFNVIGYHLVNLAIHLLAALTLFGIVRRTLLHCRLPIADCRMIEEKDESTANGSRQEPSAVPSAVIPQHSAIGNPGALARHWQSAIALYLSFCAALIWTVHPLQTESVTYVVQRAESLMGLFYLLTLYCAIRGFASQSVLSNHQGTKAPRTEKNTLTTENTELTENPSLSVSASSVSSVVSKSVAVPGALVPWWLKETWFIAAALACALGMACKEVMVTAPLALLLYDRTFIAGSFREALRRRWGLYVALAATWLILGRSILAAFSPHAASAGFAASAVTPLAYALTQPAVVLHYLQLALWPSGLCFDYGWPVARTAREILPGAVAIAALLAATIWALARRPTCRAQNIAHAWGFAAAWFFLVLAPTSSLLPIRDLAFEHRMYLPLAALAAAAVVGAYLAAGRLLRSRRLALGITALLTLCAAAGLGAVTLHRNAQYRSEISIWSDVTRTHPNNPRAWTQLGLGWLEAGNREKAGDCLDRAIALDSNYADAWQNRSIAHGRAGRWDLAIQDADAATRLNPDSAPYQSNRGAVLAALGRSAEAVAAYDRAIALDANDARTWYNRGNAHVRLRQLDAAAEDYDKSIALAPDALTYQNRGNLRLMAGRCRPALEDYDRAIGLDPRMVNAYHNRAVAWSRLGSFDRALADERRFEQLGGGMNPEFIKSLTSAAQPRNPTNP